MDCFSIKFMTKKPLLTALLFVVCISAAYWVGRTKSPILQGKLDSINVGVAGRTSSNWFTLREGSIEIYHQFVVIALANGDKQVEPLTNVWNIKISK